MSNNKINNENIATNFLEFEKQQIKTLRGGIEMYDVKGYYKYMTLPELFQYYIDYISKDK